MNASFKVVFRTKIFGNFISISKYTHILKKVSLKLYSCTFKNAIASFFLNIPTVTSCLACTWRTNRILQTVRANKSSASTKADATVS